MKSALFYIFLHYFLFNKRIKEFYALQGEKSEVPHIEYGNNKKKKKIQKKFE